MTFAGALAQAVQEAGIGEGRIGDPLAGRWRPTSIITAS